MNNLLNDIISIFLDQNVLQLRSIDVSLALNDKGFPLLTSEVLSQLKTVSPNLFKLEKTDVFTTIRVDPQIEICHDFLTGNCPRQSRGCRYLHINKNYGRYTGQESASTDDLSSDNNQELIRQMNLQNIDEKLLIKLIQSTRRPTIRTTQANDTKRKTKLKEPAIESKPRSLLSQMKALPTQNPVPVPPPARAPTLPKVPAPVLVNDDINRQIDVACPLSTGDQSTDTEMIELLLSKEGVNATKLIKESQTRHFRRATFQLASIADVKKILAKGIIQHDGVDIKFKRPKPTIDRSCFLLKTRIDRVEDKIIGGRITLYINALVGSGGNSTWTDISTDTEQIVLVQCDGELDFDRVHQQHQSRPTLKDRQMTLVHIYQYDTIIIRNMDETRVINLGDLQHIFADSWNKIFTFKFPNGPTSEVEFHTNAGLKEWLKNVESIKDKFKITVVPVINEMTDREDSSEQLKSTISTSSQLESNCVTIPLKNHRDLIANNPSFQDEMKKYFRDQLGGEIEVKGVNLTYTHSINSASNHGPLTKGLVANTANNFLQQFQIETVHNLNEEQVNILRTCPEKVILKHQCDRDYLIAAKIDVVRALKLRLFPSEKSSNVL